MKIDEVIKNHLPDDVVKAFTELGNLQRGDPESAMLKVQFAMGGGILNPVVEHVGDLTHRMSHMVEYGNMGHEYVADKVKKTLRWLRNPYGFEREYKENVRNNAKYSTEVRKKPVSVKELQTILDKTLKKYADEHRKLPVYNKMQWLAREAAVAVGEQNFNSAIKYLLSLDQYVDDRELFEREAAKFHKDRNGGLIQYENR